MSSVTGPTAPPRTWLLPYLRGATSETLVRPLLSEALGQPLDALPRDDRGRPQLQTLAGGYDANWSHSGDALLLALGRDVRVGVDIELLRPRPRAMELARRFFHRDEAAWLQSLADAARREREFVRLWCAKEAVLKAHGHGVSFGLDRLVFVDGDDGLRLVASDPALGTPEQWQLQQWQPRAGYLAALAWRTPA
ncbi:4-phosphopantetheinyl transferase [Pseudoxanthomonas kalamensis DSM 18571]|uniref:4'-phosphopantetheinyl transferase family protein n=1 Tax=Pseudoxanthomonas kalamensis TaxID=289483 RepID=UPI001390AF23|nr:4'-phosphopantetheinyl transferase superfamily protein [Pseudoxanthomonas kalamensis]KAF1712252.1 4-phosphopantetheinyl transferase [Pseudoxanthomonas kalamensis DSM 18571]